MGKKGNAGKRWLAGITAALVIGSAVAAAPIITGCTALSNALRIEQQMINEAAIQSVHAIWEQKVEEAKQRIEARQQIKGRLEIEKAKQQINEWYYENIMSYDTFICLVGGTDSAGGCSPCIINQEGLPQYDMPNSFIEIPKLIASLRAELNSYYDGKLTQEGDITTEIEAICSKYGFIKDSQGRIHFENEEIPDFSVTSIGEPVVYLIGGDNKCSAPHTSENILESGSIYTINLCCNGEIISNSHDVRKNASDMLYLFNEVQPCNRLPGNYFLDELESIKRDGERLTIIGIDLVDVMDSLRAAGLFVDVDTESYNPTVAKMFITPSDWERFGIVKYEEYVQEAKK